MSVFKQQFRATLDGVEANCRDCGEFKPHDEKHFPRWKNNGKLKYTCYTCVYETMLKNALRAETYVPSEGFIYFVLTRGGFSRTKVEYNIKIGWTMQLKQRMSAYTPHGRLLGVFYGFYSDESETHWLFRHEICRRKEWFNVSDELLKFISEFTQMPNASDIGTLKLLDPLQARAFIAEDTIAYEEYVKRHYEITDRWYEERQLQKQNKSA